MVGQSTRRWAARMGLARTPHEDRRLAALAPHLAAARMYPAASLAALNLVSDYLTWFFAVDDGIDLHGAAQQAETTLHRIRSAVQAVRDGAAPRADDPLTSAFADLYERSHGVLSTLWLGRLIGHLWATTEAFGIEARSRQSCVPPAESEYIERRRHTSCAWIFADLTELTTAAELPGAVCGWAEYRELIHCAADIAGWDNDLVSLPRELAHAEVNNLVVVLAHADGLSLEHASHAVAHRISRRIRDYLAAEQGVLIRVAATGTADGTRAVVQRIVDALRSTLAGVVAWNHGDTDRFSQPGAQPHG
jgi:hypothetical protein